MQLTILGTAQPFPVPGNACSGYLLASGETQVLVDAGTGTLAELQRHTTLDSLDAIWVSHRHADHSADLLVAYYALRATKVGAARRIRLIGPEGLDERLATYLGGDAAEGLHEVFEFTEMHGWGEALVGELALAWGPVSHGVPAFALTVTDVGGLGVERGSAGAEVVPDDGSFTYSGDTGPCTSLVEMAEESSTLLAEAGYDVAPARGEEYVHLTPEDAGRAATSAGVSTLLLTHLALGLTPAAARSRAATTFAGAVALALPGQTFTV
ncbi:MBL fold metallo-hydrolase [Subtercola vilae]|uniref:MBL fold metallo-hydrolase n=1 Tax=Subtercola vilae TaxID=2056433 RepID=A0A4V4RFM6_9MICO|nr:MBL fold metallo-hydrolase [Subtercola vilae]TIH33744.1 MBL fold metallo-hydrolase [Subtercola vilae]